MQISSNISYHFFDKKLKKSTHIYRGSLYESVAHNRHLVQKYLGGSGICILSQQHSNTIHEAKASTIINNEPQADAAVTTQNGLILGIYTADCVPILLYSRCGRIIGAVHCGWRGAKSDLIEKTVKIMHQTSPNIFAIIGPCIRQESYRVTREFMQDFASDTNNCQKYFPLANGTLTFDIATYAKDKLKQCGIKSIFDIQHNTYTMRRYYSHRKSLLSGNPTQKRLLSTIMIKSAI